MKESKADSHKPGENGPPGLSWAQWYALVLGTLALLVLLFYLFSRAFA